MGRAPCCEKIGLKRGRWTAEEDQILTNYIHTHGEGSWRSLPKNAGLLRCGKSCRLRWVNYLKSDLKRGKFSSDEDETIIKLHASLGNRWCLIAGHLPGRTDNEIKNYWNSHLSRQIYNFRKIIQQQLKQQPILPMDHQLIKPKSGNKRRGRTSRSAMKKNKSYAASKLIHTTTTQAPMPEKGTETVPMPPTPTLQEDVTSSMLLDINEDMETIDDIFLGSPFSNLVIDELEVGPDHLQTLGDDDDIQNWLVDANIVDESKGDQEDQVVEKSDEFIQTPYPNDQELDMRLDWDWDWDWDKLDIDDGLKGQEFWDSEEEKLLSWLRESTCEKGDEGDCSSSKFQTSETPSDKQNAIVEWLLS